MSSEANSKLYFTYDTAISHIFDSQNGYFMGIFHSSKRRVFALESELVSFDRNIVTCYAHMLENRNYFCYISLLPSLK